MSEGAGEREPRPRQQSPPPAPRGNLRALRHGAYAHALLLPQADELVEEIYAAFDHLTDCDYFAVRDYAITQVRVARLAAYVEKNGDHDA